MIMIILKSPKTLQDKHPTYPISFFVYHNQRKWGNGKSLSSFDSIR